MLVLIAALNIKDTRTKSMGMALNSTSIVPYLRNLVSKVGKMKDAGAYLHWYKKYIPDVDDLLSECTEEAQMIIDAYSEYII
jgi:hypothetical protein